MSAFAASANPPPAAAAQTEQGASPEHAAEPVLPGQTLQAEPAESVEQHTATPIEQDEYPAAEPEQAVLAAGPSERATEHNSPCQDLPAAEPAGDTEQNAAAAVMQAHADMLSAELDDW